MKRTWLILLVIFVLCHGLFAATWSKWNNITVGSSAGNITKWNNGTIGTTTGNIGAWNGLVSPGGGGGGAPVVHQSGFCAGSCGGGNAGTITFGGASTSSDSIPVVVYSNDRTHTFTPSCTSCGTFTAIGSTNDINGGKWFWYIASSVAATVSTVTITPSAFTGYRAWAWAVSNITAIDSGIGGGAGFVVGGTGFSGGSTLSIGPSGTLATANEILFAMVGPSGGNGIATISDADGTDGSNPSSPDTSTGGTIAYSRIPGSTTTQTFSVTWAQGSGTTVEWLMLAFK